MTSQRQPLTVGTMFGHYRLDRLIGRGGMGEVYQAYDMRKRRTVAIKVLLEKLAQDDGYRERFQREADAAARLREPHVIPIHDYGEIDGRLYIDMRLVDGASLPSVLRTKGPMAPAEAVAVIRQIATALDAAHAEGLIHRDVKPDNILLTPDGFAYLVDFGIAHSSADHRLTTHGAVIGSFSYMAPERFRAEPTTPAVDVYSLACVLYECLTGARPYPGTTDAEIISSHLFEPVPRASMIRPSVTPALDTVIARGMAKSVRERFSVASELAAAAQAALTSAGATTERRTQRSVSPEPATGVQDAVPDRTSNATGGMDNSRSTGLLEVEDAGHPEAQTTDSRPTGDRSTDGAKTGAAAPARRRRILVALILTVAAITAAGAGFGAWKLLGDRTGTAVADATALRDADIDLLKIIAQTGRKRSTCLHEQPDTSTTVAVIFCPDNPAASEPAARYMRFRSLDALRDYYNVLLRTFQAKNCPGDPAGSDGPSIRDGKEIGRKACIANRAETPTAPKPSLLMTDETQLALAFYIWPTPSDEPLRDYMSKFTGSQFLTKEAARDPDYFTREDYAVFGRLANDFGPANCSHLPPPGGAVTAYIMCSTPAEYPSALFFRLPDRQSADALYRADVGVLGGHVCGDGGGTDDAWRKAGTEVGRLFCFVDNDPDIGPRTCLLAVHDDAHLIAQFCTLAPDNPMPGPKTEAQLLNWFDKHFG
ncbi:serine/threonine-protein kinase [Nocardia sp. CA-107356]|uniref:serine/threonine-protein kinase n=1 Tax=Nocardia sp. CA-107356 TaxID=3239972 RepID=UPI003D8BB46A